MPKWNPPNALLYLGSIIRPSLIKPDLKVPTIGHVDWNALRKEGFDAVVIDKDNCLTLPEQDELYPPLQAAWSTLIAAFPPGRVLIVSNSAGTLSKDPSGVAAESVSLALRAPILLHARPKPGCAPEIVSYLSPASHPPPSFGSGSGSGSGPDISTGSSGLPGPSTLRARIAAKHREALQAEKEDVQALVERFSGLASGPVWTEGERVVAEGKGKDVLRRSFVDPDQAERDLSKQRNPISSTSTTSPASRLESSLQQSETPTQGLPKTYGPRIAVVGDRLFTDTLLANRLRALLPSQGTRDSIISIQTTLLPQPNDVRLLRRLESFLTRDRLRQCSTDWGRYAIADKAPLTSVEEKEGWRRYIPFRQAYLNSPELQWDPRSWRPVTLAVAAGRGTVWVGRKAQVWTMKGARWGWASGQRWLAQRKIGSEEIKNISKEGLP